MGVDGGAHRGGSDEHEQDAHDQRAGPVTVFGDRRMRDVAGRLGLMAGGVADRRGLC
jgi:hypothetical protein